MRDLALSFGFFVSVAAALFFAGVVRFVLSIPPDEYERNRWAVPRNKGKQQ